MTHLNDNGKQTNGERSEQSNKKPHRALWTVVFIAIAVLTVWAITAQNKNFSLKEFSEFISNSEPIWIVMAFLGSFGFIFFEGAALLCICKALGYKRRMRNGYIYSAGDIYFSAITPSATGGQPASALFMLRDGIPTSIVTVSLLLNLVMYTFAILALGILSFILAPSLFLEFSLPSKILIIIGIAALSGLATVFIALIKKPFLLHSICDKLLRLLAKLKIVRKLEKRQKKLDDWIESYHECALAVTGKTSMLIKAFIFNLLQRASLVFVTVFSFLAGGGSPSEIKDVFVRQTMVVLGSNCVPIPGAMGVADYLMLDAFSQMIEDPAAVVNLELLSRTVSFYFCVVLCGISILVRLAHDKLKSRKGTPDNT